MGNLLSAIQSKPKKTCDYWPKNELQESLHEAGDYEKSALSSDRRYAIMLYKDFDIDADETYHDTEAFICGTYLTLRDALYNYYVGYSDFGRGYIAIEKDGIFVRDVSRGLIDEWSLIRSYDSTRRIVQQYEKFRRDRAIQQKELLQDFKVTVDIVSRPDDVFFGHAKQGFARRRLHMLLDTVYNENYTEDENIADRIHDQVARCNTLQEYADKAKHQSSCYPRDDA